MKLRFVITSPYEEDVARKFVVADIAVIGATIMLAVIGLTFSLSYAICVICVLALTLLIFPPEWRVTLRRSNPK